MLEKEGRVQTVVKQTAKFITQFAITIGLMMMATHIVSYAGALPITNEAQIEYGSSIPAPEADKSGQAILKEVVFGALVYVKAILVAVGTLFIIILALQMLMSEGDEEKISTAKSGIVYIIIAFALVSMSQDIAKVFDQEDGTFFSSPQGLLERVHLFDKEVEILITFIKIIIGSYATVMLVKHGTKLITDSGEEEDISTHKKGIIYSISGLLLIYFGDIFINRVFYRINKDVYSGITGVQASIDTSEGVAQMAGIANLMVKLMAPVALLMLIGGAVMYASAGGDDDKMEKAKRIVLTSVIGIIIIFGAFALVNTIISSKLVQIGAMME